MSNAAKDIKTDLGLIPGGPYAFPVAASTLIYAGTFGAVNAAGNAIATLTGASRIFGRVEKQTDNSSGAAGDKYADVKPGFYYWDNDSTNAVTNASRGQYVYATDNHTVGTSDVGGTYPNAGWVVDVPASGQPNYGKVLVATGMARPDAYDPNLADTAAATYKARGVATSLAAFTVTSGVMLANANGAIGTQDGITLAVGDTIIIPAGTVGSATVSAADSGPWLLTSVGGASAKYGAVRPDWWVNGNTFVGGAGIRVKAGTLFAGTHWICYATDAQVIGTDDPALYPEEVIQQITLVAGTKAITNVPIRSTSKVALHATLAGGTPAGTTTAFQTKLSSGITAGALGTASITVEAQSVAGTIVNTDVAVLNVSIRNK